MLKFAIYSKSGKQTVYVSMLVMYLSVVHKKYRCFDIVLEILDRTHQALHLLYLEKYSVSDRSGFSLFLQSMTDIRALTLNVL